MPIRFRSFKALETLLIAPNGINLSVSKGTIALVRPIRRIASVTRSAASPAKVIESSGKGTFSSRFASISIQKLSLKPFIRLPRRSNCEIALLNRFFSTSGGDFKQLTDSKPKQIKDSKSRSLLELSRGKQRSVKMSPPNTTKMNGTTTFDKTQFEELMKRRFFYGQAFDIYGGISGLYDYGPPACALQSNVLDLWRRHFVIEEGMLEVDCTALTPYEVLKTSGHVDKFSDFMCKDPKTGEIFRADHLIAEVLKSRVDADNVLALSDLQVDDKVIDPAVVTSNKSKSTSKKSKVGSTVLAAPLDKAIRKEYEHTLAQLDNYGGDELGELIRKFDIRNPRTGGELLDPTAFNLMFETQIGPSGGQRGFLRPETAQGQFLNFNKLYEFNSGTIPFASASVGKSFRNEISPRSGLLRVREFMMAEIEHFVDPLEKSHPRFENVKDVRMPLLAREIQLEGSTEPVVMTIGEAVSAGIVDNSTLGYFLARIYDFLVKIGIDPEKIRFRQHLQNEMAHYATDCWDAEINVSYGWIECVGCADRSAYDLTVHSKRTGVPLIVRQQLPEPIVKQQYVIEISRKKFGPLFKKDAKKIEEAMLAWSQDELEKKCFEKESHPSIEVKCDDGSTFQVDSNLYTIEKKTVELHQREFIPNVIEPSFGIGRLLYCILEHSFWTRKEDENRNVLSIPPLVAPIKVLLVPLSSNKAFAPIVKDIELKLRKKGIISKTDASSAAIGRRYARNDELGSPYGITVDFQTVNDGTITLRERDSMKQIRGAEEDILDAIEELCTGRADWQNVSSKFCEFVGQNI